MASRRSRPPAGRRFQVYIASAAAGAAASAAAVVLFSLMMFLLRLPVSHSGVF